MDIFNKKQKSLEVCRSIKDRLLKNKGSILEMMGEKLDGNKICPHFLGHECVGKFCMKFMEFKNVKKDGTETSFWNCVDVQTPLLLIELNRNVKELNDTIKKDTQGAGK